MVEVYRSARDAGLNLQTVEIAGLVKQISLQLEVATRESQRLGAKIAELTERITTGAASVGRIEGRAEVERIQQDLRSKLVSNYKSSILVEGLISSLNELVITQRDEGIKPLYLHLRELWRRWRPEQDWEIRFDKQGRIELHSRDTSLTFAQLSGGEKTVLLILSRVLLLGLLSQMDFLMIDEPLEHLDLRNRRAVLNFLVASSQCGLAQQALVTTFEESLVRKYLDGQSTNTVYLSP